MAAIPTAVIIANSHCKSLVTVYRALEIPITAAITTSCPYQRMVKGKVYNIYIFSTAQLELPIDYSAAEVVIIVEGGMGHTAMTRVVAARQRARRAKIVVLKDVQQLTLLQCF